MQTSPTQQPAANRPSIQLVELRQPPVSINDPRGTGSVDGASALSGILGSILGESPEAQKARIEEATRGATDVSNLVKRKKPAAAVPEKRKAEDEDGPEREDPGAGKKARVEDADEE